MSLGLDEIKGKEVKRDREVDASYGVLRIIWMAILAGVVLLFVVTRVIEPSAVAGGSTLFWALAALGLTTFGASFLLKAKLRKQGVEKRKVELVRSAYILAFALCEATGLLGLAAHLVTGVQQYYFLFVLSGFGILLHKPQRDDLLAAINGGAI